MSLLTVFSRSKRRVERPDEDPTGLARAVSDFNGHDGPARIFYNRNSKAFFTLASEDGEDRWWPVAMTRGMDVAELYRKTTAWGGQQVTREALLMMEQALEPYSEW